MTSGVRENRHIADALCLSFHSKCELDLAVEYGPMFGSRLNVVVQARRVHMIHRFLLGCSVAIAILCSTSSLAFAQLAQGELRGTVADESGGVLPGVTVTAVHVETGTSR